jgi:hypothetical protein
MRRLPGHCCSALDTEDVYRCIAVRGVRLDKELLRRAGSACMWSFTGNCGPFGNARGPTTHGLCGLDDPDSVAYEDMLTLIAELPRSERPSCILMENIPSFLSSARRLCNKSTVMGDGPWWLHQLADLGYCVEVHLPSVDSLEVPQNRRRAMVVAFKDPAHHSTWVCMGAPQPSSQRPPLHSIFQSRHELGARAKDYAVDRVGVERYMDTVGLESGHCIVSRMCIAPGKTLRATYQPARTIPNCERKEIPYGMYLAEGSGSVRMLTEVECGCYMGLTKQEAACLPLGASTYYALGNAVIVHEAEQFVQQALQCMEMPTCQRAVCEGQWGPAWHIATQRCPELVRARSGSHPCRTLWVTR